MAKKTKKSKSVFPQALIASLILSLAITFIVIVSMAGFSGQGVAYFFAFGGMILSIFVFSLTLVISFPIFFLFLSVNQKEN